MCEYGDTVKMSVLVSLPNRYGVPYWSQIGPIDRCIAQLVEVLNNGGVETIASCCGHGHMHGNIALKDGRWLVILPDRDAVEKHFDQFHENIHGEPR